MPFRPPSEAAFRAPFTSATVTGRPSSTARSTRETLAVGTRRATPLSFPFSSGMTSPTAVAAPVDVGTMESAAALALLRSLWEPSRSRWSIV